QVRRLGERWTREQRDGRLVNVDGHVGSDVGEMRPGRRERREFSRQGESPKPSCGRAGDAPSALRSSAPDEVETRGRVRSVALDVVERRAGERRQRRERWIVLDVAE